ncbi:MAG TPA: ATP-binding protein, partial [Burkholderiales bacterium]|nr:ATP-binding protein [Burkholderiales bacterium]
LDDLLELARIANASCTPQKTDLSGYAEDIIADLRAAAPQWQGEVIIEPGCVVNGDPHLLQTALQRLLANAWKFSAQAKPPCIEVGCRKEGKETAVWVRDNGVGFDPAHAHRLFQPLQRLHRTDQFAGSGVGLAIVKRVIDRHGGRVWAKNLKEGGACFGFALPD